MSLYDICMKIINFLVGKEVPLNFKSNNSLIKSKEFNRKYSGKPLPLDISRAKLIYLPQLRFTIDSSNEEIDRNDNIIYWSSFNAGLDYYRNKRYQRAKECFLKIYDMNHRSSSYFTHLLRTYRKLVDNYISEQFYDKAKNELLELFSKCPNATNTDIKKYNKLIDIIGGIIDKKDLNINIESDFNINSEYISFLYDCKKPKGI